MAITHNLLPFLTRFNTRLTWITGLVFLVLIWTILHLNVNYIPSQRKAQQGGSRIPFSHENKNPDAEPIYFHHDHPEHTGTLSPAFTELAKAPLQIYVPSVAADPPPDILSDIWDTAVHKIAEESKHRPNDFETYYKALKCPVCVNPTEDQAHGKSCPTWDDVPKDRICDPEVLNAAKCLLDLNTTSAASPTTAQDEKPAATPSAKPLISYVYTESESSRANLAFFVKHALHYEADFVFTIIGESTVIEDVLPKGQTHINIFNKPAFDIGCNPFTAHAAVLGGNPEDDRKPLQETYDNFILLDSSVRGPFIPRWSRSCWTTSFISLLSEKTKLVGTSLACLEGQRPHLQSHILATDKAGLAKLLEDNRLAAKACPAGEEAEATKVRKEAERDLTYVIREAGWDAYPLEMVFKDESEYRYVKCAMDQERFVGEGVVQRERRNSNATQAEEKSQAVPIDPWEVMFINAVGEMGEAERKTLDKVSAKVNQTAYTSFEACRKLG